MKTPFPKTLVSLLLTTTTRKLASALLLPTPNYSLELGFGLSSKCLSNRGKVSSSAIVNICNIPMFSRTKSLLPSTSSSTPKMKASVPRICGSKKRLFSSSSGNGFGTAEGEDKSSSDDDEAGKNGNVKKMGHVNVVDDVVNPNVLMMQNKTEWNLR